MRSTSQASYLTQRIRAETKVVLAAWAVGMTIWLSGVASLVLFF